MGTKSMDIAKIIRILRKQNLPFSKIGDVLGLKKSTVFSKLKQKSKKKGEKSGRSVGRPRKLSDVWEKRVISACRRERGDSAKNITHSLKRGGFSSTVHRRTICRVLRRNGYRYGKLKRKPHIPEKSKKQRMAFLKKYDGIDWKRVIFSDEKRFALRPDGPRCRWMKSRESTHSKNMVFTEHFSGGSLMVWGAIRSDGRIWLRRCTDHLNQKEYNSLVESAMRTNLFSRASKTKTMYFQQDNASPHKSAYLERAINSRGVTLMKWPSYSPDLNIIEHLWPMISRRLGEERYKSKDALWEAISNVCEELDGSACVRRLFGSMEKRLAELKKSRGGNTLY